MTTFEFRPLTDADFAMLYEWRRRPHIAQMWGAPESVEELQAHYADRLQPDSAVRVYIAWHEGRPVGFIQSYVAANAGDGWWTDITDPGVVGTDQFLADPADLNHGLGTAMVRDFIAMLCRDPAIHTVQVDPEPGNLRAIRCYEKAGFRAVGEIDTPDGRALLMRLRCEAKPPLAREDFVV